MPNKIDLEDAAIRLELMHESKKWDYAEFVVSAASGTGLEELRTAAYQALEVMRIYTKHPKAKEPDYERPFTLRRGGTVADVATLVHKDFAEQLKTARVWGAGVHDGTPVKGDHVLSDKDVVELHI